MKRVNQYFSGGCIAFTVISIISIIMHLFDSRPAILIKSEISILLIILLIQAVLYFMENFRIKSQIMHMAIELSINMAVAYAIGIPIGLITVTNINSVIQIILIIVAAYGITSLSMYLNGLKDANEINSRLQQR